MQETWPVGIRVTMKEVLAPTNATDATFFTMELLLGQVIIIEVAHITEVLTKLRAAFYTIASWRLLGAARAAHDALHVMTVHHMPFFRVLLGIGLFGIMAEAA